MTQHEVITRGAAPGVRHDLRHVLATLQLVLEATPTGDERPPRQRTELMEAARREVRLALELSAALPAEEDARDGPWPPDPQDGSSSGPGAACDLDAVVRSAAAIGATGGRTVSVDSVPGLWVAMHRVPLMRTVRNLIWNALAATSPLGTVLLRARPVPPDAEGIGTRRSAAAVRLEVHDDGPGPGRAGFSRHGGAGLGIVRSLVLPVGGWLVLGHSPAGGACASVTLPAAVEGVRS